MKDSVWYKKLWQKKMQEVPLRGDEGAAWDKMQALLDKNMPMETAVPIQKPGQAFWPFAIPVIAIIIIALISYFISTNLSAGHHKTDNQPGRLLIDKNKTGTSEHAGLHGSGKAVNNKAATHVASVYDKVAGNKPTSSSSAQTKKGAQVNYNTVVNANLHNAKQAKNGKPLLSNKNKVGSVNAATFNTRLNPDNSQINSHLHNHYYLPRGNANQAVPANSATKGINDAGASKWVSVNNNTQNSQAVIQKNNNTIPAQAIDSEVSASAPAGNKADQVTAGSTAKPKPLAPAVKNKTGLPKKSRANSKLEFDLKIGVNSNGSFTGTSQNTNFYGKSGVDAFLGVSAAYQLNPTWSVGIGANILSPKLIAGSYSNNNLSYTTIGDTGKLITHNTGKVTIHASGKIHIIDVPIFADYKVNDNVSFIGGPVLSIPVKHESLKTNISLLTNSTDSTAQKQVIPYANGTTMTNNFSVGISGGVRLNFNRLFIDGTYMQNVTPYTISSGLGSNKVYYHTVQVGIGFHLFRPKSK